MVWYGGGGMRCLAVFVQSYSPHFPRSLKNLSTPLVVCGLCLCLQWCSTFGGHKHQLGWLSKMQMLGPWAQLRCGGWWSMDPQGEVLLLCLALGHSVCQLQAPHLSESWISAPPCTGMLKLPSGLGSCFLLLAYSYFKSHLFALPSQGPLFQFLWLLLNVSPSNPSPSSL